MKNPVSKRNGKDVKPDEGNRNIDAGLFKGA